jgi:hypothetical protein
MELEARVSVVLPAMSGVSQASGNQWMSQEYVLEYFWFPNQTNPSRIVMKVFGEDKIKQFNLQPYDEVKVRFHIEAHEHNGRWYNETRIDGVTFIGACIAKNGQNIAAQASAQQTTQATQSQQQPFPSKVDANGNPTGEKKDGLPF